MSTHDCITFASLNSLHPLPAFAEVEINESYVTYKSPNIEVSLQEKGDCYLHTVDKDFSRIVVLDSYRSVNQLMLSRPQMNFNLMDLTKEGMEEIMTGLTQLAAQIRQAKQEGNLGNFVNSVQIYPNYIQYQDAGMEIVVTTNGLAYMRLASGVVVQITPRALVVKDANGQVKAMDLSQTRRELQILSAALDAEAKYWISSSRSSG